MTIKEDKRIYGLDALRAMAMLLGIVLHAAIAYKVFPNPTWPADDAYHSYWYDGAYWMIHTFRMQLFYLVAGFFARMLYLKIGEKDFISHRIKRIAIPFAGSLIFILPFTIAPFLYYKYFIAEQLSYADAMAHFRVQMFRWNGMAHLWFLYYLMIFYCGMLLLLHRRIQNLVPAVLLKWSFNFGKIGQLLLATLVLTGIHLLFFEGPVVEVSTGIFPKISHLLYYGFFFILGYYVHKNSGQLELIARRTGLYLLTGACIALALFSVVVLPIGITLSPVLVKAGVALQTMLLTFGVMGFFLRYLNRQNDTFRYISDAAYWLYLVHLAVVAGLQIAFLHSPVPGACRFFLVLLITTGFGIGTYHLFIRYSFIGSILHGPRMRRKYVIN